MGHRLKESRKQNQKFLNMWPGEKILALPFTSGCTNVSDQFFLYFYHFDPAGYHHITDHSRLGFIGWRVK